jgi:site-specific recombinase XerD
VKESTKQQSPEKQASVWQKTQYSNLVRYTPSGGYYARFRVGGKLVWKSLDTDKISIAQIRLPDLLKEYRQRSQQDREVRRGKMTLGDALQIVLQRIQGNPGRKPRTKTNAEERIRALKRTWPELERLDVRQIKKSDCLAWAAKVGASVSPTRFNQFVRFLRWALEVAVEHGNRFDNPAKSIGWMREKPKQLRLPEPKEFERLVQAIRDCGWINAGESAQFVEFLAYTGCRLTEALNVRWADVDFTKGKIRVSGDPQTGTKNSESREVPMIPDARRLLEQIHAERPDESLEATVMRYKGSRKALANACKRIGISKITHHDLRHLFATRCIESGVDIPTVSRWLGHKDGGALAMRVYGHLRDQHSTEMAQKVTFSTPSAAQDRKS